MTPVRLWIGLVLVVLGVFGVLDATGTLESTDVIDRWWPVAIIGAGLLVMAVHRRITVEPAIVVVVGLALLAGQQDWTTEDLFGRALLVVIGLAVLVGATTSRRPKGREISAGSPFAIFGGSTMKGRSSEASMWLTSPSEERVIGGGPACGARAELPGRSSESRVDVAAIERDDREPQADRGHAQQDERMPDIETVAERHVLAVVVEG